MSSPAASPGGIRRATAIATAAVASWATRRTGRHGTAFPGLLARRIDPGILTGLGRDLRPVVLVGGTNGKTTTTRLATLVLEATLGQRPVSNRSGANLEQGIVTAILADGSRTRTPRPAVFEVDELAFPAIASALRPSVVVLLNLVRDQLDRYGEVDAVERSWLTALRTLPSTTQLVVCGDDPRLESIARESGLAAKRFGLVGPEPVALEPARAGSGSSRGPSAGAGAGDVARPTAWSGTGVSAPCPSCGAATRVDDASVSLGAWTCASCGFERPPLALGVRSGGVRDGWLELVFEATPGLAGSSPGNTVPLRARVGLTGTAGAHDSAAAVLAAMCLGVPAATAVAALDGATPAFGRLEEIAVAGRRIVLTLTKNPASVAQAVEAVAVRRPDRIIVGLGDRHADGRDTSWIWDAPLDRLADLAPLTLTGSRADDLAVRFKYAVGGLDHRHDPPLVEPSIETALTQSLGRVPPGGTVMVLGTYTALLAIRRVLERRGLAAAMPR